MNKLNSNYNVKKFLRTSKGKKIKTLLLGNGFCLDHPKLGDCFNFNHEDIFAIIGKVGLYLGTRELEKLKNTKCPEKFLDIYRWTICKEVIIHYSEKLQDKIKSFNQASKKKFNNLYEEYLEIQKQFECASTLDRFENIFTVNYDPLMYFALLELKAKRPVIDGFKGKDKIDELEIVQRLESKSGLKFYFLHGSNFIVYDRECKKLYKLNPDEIIPEKILHEKNSESKEVPYLIFEDRATNKQALFDVSQYFTFCRNKLLESEGDLLIFGLSLENDAHLIDMLLEYAERNHSKSKKVYVTYLENRRAENMGAYSHKPNKRIRNIAEKYLKVQYTIQPNLGEHRFNCRINQLESIIENLPIAQEEETDFIRGIFWNKTNVISRLLK